MPKVSAAQPFSLQMLFEGAFSNHSSQVFTTCCCNLNARSLKHHLGLCRESSLTIITDFDTLTKYPKSGPNFKILSYQLRRLLSVPPAEESSAYQICSILRQRISGKIPMAYVAMVRGCPVWCLPRSDCLTINI